MKIALVGFGVENRAAFDYLSKAGHTLSIHDSNQDLTLPANTSAVLGPNYLDDLDAYDMIIRTSGMHPGAILDKNPSVGAKITTAINIFFEKCTTPIIGITGTKGKGTTSTLIYKILQSAGKKAILAGNIGIPALSMLDEANQSDYAVLELSSFQLYDIQHSPQIGVCLMVVPEHLNWHSDFDDYINSKANMFRYQKETDVVVFNQDNENSIKIASTSKTQNRLSYSTAQATADVHIRDNAIYFGSDKICDISSVQLTGSHNLENVCAAIAATWPITNKNRDAIESAISGFSGLPYRIEFVREINGVKYYNDSFSTTPETAIAAIRAFEAPKIAILGGSDKGIAFDQLAREVTQNNVKHVIAIGETGQIIAKLLQNQGFNQITTDNMTSMEAIVKKAQNLSENGDIVLLSTGSASFDMFRDYKDRGDQFNQSVLTLS